MSRADDPSLPPRRPKPRPVTEDEILAMPPARGPSPTQAPGKSSSGSSSKRTRKEPLQAQGGPNLVERLLFGRVSTAHLALFCRQFSSYLDAGVDLSKALTGLEKQFARTALGPVIQRVRASITSGDSLADAMEREPKAFDKFFLSMAKIAEARGGMPETLRLMADHYEARVRLIRQARSAMIYPVIVVVVASGVAAFLTIVLLPMLAGFLREIAGREGGELPLPSRVLIMISEFMKGHGWWAVPVATVGGVFIALRLYTTKSGKAMFDEIGIHVPVLGKLLRMTDTCRLARCLAVLLEAGVDINSSLKLTAEVLRTHPYRRAVEKTHQAVLDGAFLSEALDATRLFDPNVIAIVETGEETGKLPQSLEKLADDYEERVTYLVKNLGSLVQPMILIFLGGIVLFIILAVLLPYLSMLSNLAR